MEIESIDLKRGYSLKLIAGTAEIYAVEKENSLKELNDILNHYRKSETKQKLFANKKIALKALKIGHFQFTIIQN